MQDTITTTTNPAVKMDPIHMEEIWIKTGAGYNNSSSTTTTGDLSLGERIQCGASLLTLTNLISKEEIEYLVRSSLAAAAALYLKSNKVSDRLNLGILDQRVPENAYTRMSTVAAAKRENRPDALPEGISLLLEEILERTFLFIDQQLCPSLKKTLLGDDSLSIAELFQTNQLEFSVQEPAINVYVAPHGHFGMHKDNNDLTILVPLSDPACHFTGGGTAFWSQTFPKEGLDDPSIVLIPKGGTAMIFGGGVSHKGMHIDSGNRVVFVASFSRTGHVGSY